MSDKKRKILMISDDIRSKSGVATMTKQIIEGSKDVFDWVQLAGLRNHPKDRVINEVDGVLVYGAKDFGDERYLHEIIEKENPDGIIFFTDPRYFTNQFFCEYEVRQNIPYMYYTIWDNFPIPKYNKPYYESCDGLFPISKVTHSIVSSLVEDKVIKYIPHGIDEELFKPMDRTEKRFQNKVRKMIGFDPFEYQFIAFWSNKNMERKRPKDLMVAFDRFIEENDLYEYDACLVMNTNPTSGSGSDLYTFRRDNIKNVDNIKFIPNGSFEREDLPYLYNMADIVINNSNNEGWGLAVTEAKMCGVPVMATKTGGMIEQIFEGDREGEWAFVLYPDSDNIAGIGDTPYISRSNVSRDQIVTRFTEAFNHTYDQLREKGMKGREHAIRSGHTDKQMVASITDGINNVIDNFTPREKLKLKKFHNG